jgi:hypothetical protein
VPKSNSLLFAALLALGFLIPLTASSKAYAICDGPRKIYTISNGRKTQRVVLASDWMEAGIRAGYHQSAMAQWNASVNASVSAEGSVIFAKASATLGVTVGRTWGTTKVWNYDGPAVPRGKKGRLVLYHEGRGFVVTKESLRAPCRYVTDWSYAVDAPTSAGYNIWRMQYINDSFADVPPADPESFDEEIELGEDPSSGQEGDPVDEDADAVPEETSLVVPAAVDHLLAAAKLVVGLA